MKLSLFKIVSVALILVSTNLSAQLPDRIGGLVSVDRNAAMLSKQETPHTALSSIIDKESVFYVPSAVNAFNYLNNRPNIADVMTWEPNFALLSKSLDFGITSGKTDFQKVGAVQRTGQYITIWKRNKKGEWKVDLRAEVENYGKNKPKEMTFVEPDDSWYLKHRSKVRLQQREDIVMSTDELFSTVMKADNQAAYNEFLADDARFYFPWEEEIEGKNSILTFLKKKRLEIITEPLKVGRAYSGELAYSQGTATVIDNDKAMKFNYIRVWQLNDDYQWRVVLEMLFER